MNKVILTALIAFAIPAVSLASGIEIIKESGAEGSTYSITIEMLLLMAGLTILPSVIMMMTSFTRVIVVLAILRQALGTMQTPSNQILVGLAFFLSIFIMTPTLTQINEVAIQPLIAGEMTSFDAVKKAEIPIRKFMMDQTREEDLAIFLNIAKVGEIEDRSEVPFSVLVPAFITSELKTAFQIGFMIFLPFVVIDLVVASVLMSMGMMMLSPMMVSLPFKLMLFVMIDGWSLLMASLAMSFN
jgi:flagellar biosynthetic protein FliP